MRDAVAADFSAIARLAARNDLFTGELRERAFARLLGPQYHESPAAARLHPIAERDDTIVGHYGVMPFPYRIAGEAVSVGIAGNLVIDEHHRRGHVFARMQHHLTRTFPERGFAFVYAIGARPEVISLNIRVGWRITAKLPVLAKPYRVAAILQRVLPHPMLRTAGMPFASAASRLWRRLHARGAAGVEVTESAQFPEDIDGFAAAFTCAQSIGAERSRAVLAWRFSPALGRDYRIFVARRAGAVIGYAVTRLMEMGGLRVQAFVDLAVGAEDRGAEAALFAACDHQALAAAVDAATALAPAGSTAHARYRAGGFLTTPERLTLLTQRSPFFAGPAIDEAFVRAWSPGWFDHDYV